MALSCQTFSLGHVLIYHAFGAVVRVAYSDLDGGDEDNQGGVRRVASPSKAANTL